MRNLNVEHLTNRLAADDHHAMKEIFHDFFPLVYQKIFQIIRQKEISEDLAQEVFLKVWRKRNELQINESIEGYLVTMAYHEALAFLRKKRPRLLEIDAEAKQTDIRSDGHLEIESQDLQDVVEQAINGLPPRCRDIFVLSRYEGKSYREIGELMNISVKTVENQMVKALSNLRVSLKDLLTIWLLWLF